MPWKAVSVMDQRLEFVSLASQDGANKKELARRFGISRQKGYKWLKRYREQGLAGLLDQSKRPRHSPHQTSAKMEERVLAVRDEHPAWGGRKIHARLVMLGHDENELPSPSTITEILRRHGRIAEAASAQQGPWQRFEHARPNDLWQMDFKGDFGLANGKRCHPLTVLDDHSRYAIALQACRDQQRQTVHHRLTEVFRQYGLPRAMLMDNGTPWAVSHMPGGGYTKLSVWLLRLDIRVIRSRPYHPQTQGKEERFHRTLKLELLREHRFADHDEAQRHFDPWRGMYNTERPHESCGNRPPVTRYQPSVRRMPERLTEPEYPSGDVLRRVNPVGQLQFQGRTFKISEAFAGQRVALRPTLRDGEMEVYYAGFRVGRIDLRSRRSRAADAACGGTPVAALPPSRHTSLLV